MIYNLYSKTWMRNHSLLISYGFIATVISIDMYSIGKKVISFGKDIYNQNNQKQSLKGHRFSKLERAHIIKGLCFAGMGIIAAFYGKNIIHMTCRILKQNPICIKIINLFEQYKERIWSLPKPPETKENVFAGYLSISVLHGIQSKRTASKVKKVMHAVFSAIAMITPVIMGLGIYETRWHHLMIGLLTSLTGLNALSLFGAAMIFDSIGYWLNPLSADKYGFDNIYVESIELMTAILAISTVIELGRKLKQKYEQHKINFYNPLSRPFKQFCEYRKRIDFKKYCFF